MKLKTYAVFFLAAFLISSCQKNEKDSGVVSQKFIHKYGFEVSQKEWEARNKNGEVIVTLSNGVTQSTAYKSGVLHGLQTTTFPHSKAIQESCEYDEGVLVKKISYEPSGLPIQEYSYDNEGKRMLTLWDKNGVPLCMEEYENDLLWSGRYYNSQNEIEGTVVNGQGTKIKRNRDGLLLSKEIVDNGKIIERKTFHPNGELQSISSFEDYELNGKQETFSPAGKLITSTNWVHGKIDGTVQCYRENKLVNEIPYVDGKKQGLEKEYDLNGAVVKEVHWENDKRHGTSRSYYDDYTDIQWFWKGVAVDLQKFQEMEFRDQLMAELRGEAPFGQAKPIDIEPEESVQ